MLTDAAIRGNEEAKTEEAAIRAGHEIEAPPAARLRLNLLPLPPKRDALPSR
jgi:hypothetical protein